MRRAEHIRNAARTIGREAARYSQRFVQETSDLRDATKARDLRGRVEGLLIAAHICDGDDWTPSGIAAEATAYVHAGVGPAELTHDQIMDAYRRGAYD